MARWNISGLFVFDVIADTKEEAFDKIFNAAARDRDLLDLVCQMSETKEVPYVALPPGGGAYRWAATATKHRFADLVWEGGRDQMWGMFDGSWWWTDGHAMLRCDGEPPPEGEPGKRWRRVDDEAFAKSFRPDAIRRATGWSHELSSGRLVPAGAARNGRPRDRHPGEVPRHGRGGASGPDLGDRRQHHGAVLRPRSRGPNHGHRRRDAVEGSSATRERAGERSAEVISPAHDQLAYAERQFEHFKLRVLHAQLEVQVQIALGHPNEAKQLLERSRNWMQNLADCNDTIARIREVVGELEKGAPEGSK
jgi:hypothetical protein